MRVVYLFTELLEPGEGVRCVLDGERFVILMQQGMREDDLARMLSVKMTQQVASSWMYVGDVVNA